MFLRFTVENHGSFSQPAELSFVATSRSDSPDWRMPSRHVKHGVLPALGLWGANASGKSQLLGALGLLRSAVRYSQTRWEPNAGVPWNPFRMRYDGPPTVMELELLLDDVRHAFGFAITAAGFSEEWLYRWSGTRRQVIYHRDEMSPDDETFYFGPSFKGQRKAIEDITRANSLFLSAGAQQNHELLLPIYDKIAGAIRIERGLTASPPVFAGQDPIVGPRLRPRLVKLLQLADLGVIDATVERAQARPGSHDEVRFRLVHRGEEGQTWTLDPMLESRGTHALIARCHDILYALDEGQMLVIDELDTSLHPDLCAALVDLFTDSASNPSGAQLLFTTHDRGLLSRLRADEVALIDKASDGRSTIRAASDFRGIRKRDDLRTAHQRGRIGGIPVLGNLAEAMVED